MECTAVTWNRRANARPIDPSTGSLELRGCRYPVVDITSVLPCIPKPASKAAESVVRQWWKDFASAPDIEVQKVDCWVSRTKTKGDNPSGRSAADEIEVSCNRISVGIASLKSREDRGGKYPFDAAAINGKDAKTLVSRPRLWNSALWIRSRRARVSGFESSSAF